MFSGWRLASPCRRCQKSAFQVNGGGASYPAQRKDMMARSTTTSYSAINNKSKGLAASKHHHRSACYIGKAIIVGLLN